MEDLLDGGPSGSVCSHFITTINTINTINTNPYACYTNGWNPYFNAQTPTWNPYVNVDNTGWNPMPWCTSPRDPISRWIT